MFINIIIWTITQKRESQQQPARNRFLKSWKLNVQITITDTRVSFHRSLTLRTKEHLHNKNLPKILWRPSRNPLQILKGSPLNLPWFLTQLTFSQYILSKIDKKIEKILTVLAQDSVKPDFLVKNKKFQKTARITLKRII